MRVSILASGSKGNAAFVEMDGRRFLVDAGIGVRRIRKELESLSVPLESLDAVLITHEHSDHIQGLGALLRACPLPVYSRPGTIRALSRRSGVPSECLHVLHDEMMLDGVRVTAFSLPHDAADPVGYIIDGSRRCTVATDLGFVTGAVQSSLEGADALVLEANHDPAMLRQGSYPWPLQQRILGNRGHLANSEAAWALARMKKRPAKVFLAHLSAENNRPELAGDTVRAILHDQGIPLAEMDIALARQDGIVSL